MNKEKRAQRARQVKKQANVVRGKENDRSRVGTHMKTINLQLQTCEEYREMPASLLREMATRMDAGEELPEKVKDTCIAILDQVHANLTTFDSRLSEIKQDIEEFKKTDIKDKDTLTINAMGLCESMESLYTQHIGLYAVDASSLNEQLILGEE